MIQLDIVYDVYNKSTIKHCGKERRQGGKPPVKYTIQGVNTKVPKQWQRFLAESENKRQLIVVISAYIF